MMKKIQSPLALALLIFSVTGLLWSILPPTHETLAIPMQEVRLDYDESDQYATLMTPYLMQLSLPTSLKLGGKATFTFALNKTEEALFLTPTDVNLYDHFTVLIELRPEFKNLAIDPVGSMSTSLIERQDISSQWTFKSTTNENQSGIFWVYLTFFPLNPDQEPQRTAILAKELSFETRTFLGLSTGPTAIIAAAGLTASFFLGWPILSKQLLKKSRKTKKEVIR